MRNIIARHTNLGGDNWIYQDDVTGIVDIETPRYVPNPNVLIEYEDEGQVTEDNPNGDAYITIDFNTQQIIDFRATNKMYPLP